MNLLASQECINTHDPKVQNTSLVITLAYLEQREQFLAEIYLTLAWKFFIMS